MWFNKVGTPLSLLSLVVLQTIIYPDFTEARTGKYDPKYDYVIWPYVEQGAENATTIRCFTELRKEQVGHNFVVDLSSAERDGTCMIRLPQGTSFEFVDVNFEKPTTFTRVLSGDHRYRPHIRTEAIFEETPKSEYGTFTLTCRHNYFTLLSFV
uniref:Uncharacterized protein n=1 Tax=Panagrolaimus sp. JU765 TaxID=591449 RepID=A0AC34QTU7_9BILA